MDLDYGTAAGNIRAAIAANSVLQEMDIGGVHLKLRSVAEMREALGWIEREQAKAAGTSASTRYASVSKGF